MILDNAERYLIYSTTSPAKYVRNKRNPLWEKAEIILKDNFYRLITTDGVSDTIIFFKR